MRVVVVLFRLPEGSSNARHKEFHRMIHGRNTSTWGGKYSYRLRGLLDEMPHVKMFRCAVLIRKEHLPMLEMLLRSYSAEYLWREVKPSKEDLQALSKPLE
jgi:hypothetical protein